MHCSSGIRSDIADAGKNTADNQRDTENLDAQVREPDRVDQQHDPNQDLADKQENQL